MAGDFVELYRDNIKLVSANTKLKRENEKLEKEISLLRDSNRELAKKLKSKRYAAVDFAVDSVYKIMRKKTKKKLILEKNSKIDVNIKKSTGSKNAKDSGVKKRAIKKGKVDIVNVNFYDWDGKIVYKGGAERYVYDLACLLKEMGYEVRILQCSNLPFRKKFKGIDVVGIGAGSRCDMRECSRAFAYYCADCEFIIASPFVLACEIKNIPVIGINHGIDFDGDRNQYIFGWGFRYDEIIKALNNVVSCVCVDTNFINWTRTQDYKSSIKEVYIPNYYEEKQFAMNRERKKENGKLVFVYPRRIYSARGADITIRAFRKMMDKYSDKVILRFVGQVDNEKIGKRLEKLMKDFPKNVFRVEYDMSQMMMAYKDADVALIPTRYSEGTSLSCIESMASGCAVIATNVGGLPNLVIDGYNGRLISPSTDDLYAAMVEMVENPKFRKMVASNGNNVAKVAFTKKVWDERWKLEIERVGRNSR